MAQADSIDDRNQKQGPAPPLGERLALLYQGILTAIVRIQSGKQPIANPVAFAGQMENLLGEIEREGRRDGYRDQDVTDARYVVVAFLDEAIRRSNDPARDRWPSLHTRLFGQAVAGEAVFDRLRAIRARRDSPELADLLEVYCLCLLLGFEGRYAVERRSGLEMLTEELLDQIERIRGRRGALSPDGSMKPDPIRPPAPMMTDEKLKWTAMATAGLACLCWVVLNWGFLAPYAGDVARGLRVP